LEGREIFLAAALKLRGVRGVGGAGNRRMREVRSFLVKELALRVREPVRLDID
jgi:hypothetical protein